MHSLLRGIKIALTPIQRAYVSAGRPLLPVTRLIREPVRWYYHRSPLLRYDAKRYLKPYLLSHVHSELVGDHPHDYLIYHDRIRFRSFGSLMSVQGYYVGEIEYHLVRYVAEQIKPGFTMFDVGAHHGLYTLVAAYELKSRGWTGVIHSFEPDPQNFMLLEHNVQQNGLSEYVILHPEAVSNRVDKQNLLISPGENSGNTLESNRDFAIADSAKNIMRCPVTVMPLDNLSDRIPSVDLIKIDVQGSETQVLCGGEKIIERDKPILAVEAVQEWESSEQIKEFLTSHRYNIYGIDSNSRLCPPNSSEVFVSWDWIGLPA